VGSEATGCADASVAKETRAISERADFMGGGWGPFGMRSDTPEDNR
jgi:hypothetical protein